MKTMFKLTTIIFLFIVLAGNTNSEPFWVQNTQSIQNTGSILNLNPAYPALFQSYNNIYNNIMTPFRYNAVQTMPDITQLPSDINSVLLLSESSQTRQINNNTFENSANRNNVDPLSKLSARDRRILDIYGERILQQVFPEIDIKMIRKLDTLSLKDMAVTWNVQQKNKNEIKQGKSPIIVKANTTYKIIPNKLNVAININAPLDSRADIRMFTQYWHKNAVSGTIGYQFKSGDNWENILRTGFYSGVGFKIGKYNLECNIASGNYYYMSFQSPF